MPKSRLSSRPRAMSAFGASWGSSDAAYSRMLVSMKTLATVGPFAGGLFSNRCLAVCQRLYEFFAGLGASLDTAPVGAAPRDLPQEINQQPIQGFALLRRRLRCCFPRRIVE